jgi:PPR repeat/Pentatricopeptide repeat domain
MSPSLREDLNKQLTHFDELGENMFENKTVAPDVVMKQIDTSFESFFYQRAYNQHNFNFYLQVLAQQEKPELAMKAFERMRAMSIAPTDETFTHLMLVHAKQRQIDKVLELDKLATETYKINPSMNRLNSVILAYTKIGEPWKGEALIQEMREKMGMQPDVVCYTTLIHGYARLN